MHANERLEQLRALLHQPLTPELIEEVCAMLRVWPVTEGREVGQAYARDRFEADARRLSSGAGTVGSWRTLASVIDGWTEAASAPVALENVAPRLERWHDRVRLAPIDWLRRAIQGETPAGWPLVRALELSTCASLHNAERLWRRNLFGGITTLLMGTVRLRPDDLRRLVVAAPGLQHVEASWAGAPAWARAYITNELDPIINRRHGPPLSLALGGRELVMEQLRGLLGSHAGQSLCGLGLDSMGITAEHLQLLVASRARQTLRWLDLSLAPMGDGGLHELSRAELPALERLTLRQVGLTRDGAEALSHASWLEGLHTLELRSNALGGQGGRALLARKSMKHLETLDLSATGIDDGVALDALSATEGGRLRRLAMRDNLLGDVAARALASSPVLAGLVVLNLRANRIGPEGARALAEAPAPEGLRHLCLRANPLGDAGVEALVGSALLARVGRLDLSSTGMTDAGLAALARSPHIGAVTELHLRNNNISAQGLEHLIDSPLLSRLEVLNLRGNAIDDDAAERLSEAHGAARLRHLNLRENFLTGQGVRSLVKSPALTGLERLNVQRNYLPRRGDRQLPSRRGLLLLDNAPRN